jgi:hypothetical protein
VFFVFILYNNKLKNCHGQTAHRPLEKGEKKKKNQRRFRRRKSLWPVPPQKTLSELSRHG